MNQNGIAENKLRIFVAGDVDAGKTILVTQLLRELGVFGHIAPRERIALYDWKDADKKLVDASIPSLLTGEPREPLVFTFQTSSKIIELYISTSTMKKSRLLLDKWYSFGFDPLVLVLSADNGCFEMSMSNNSVFRTFLHLGVLFRSRIIVVVTKLDLFFNRDHNIKNNMNVGEKNNDNIDDDNNNDEMKKNDDMSEDEKRFNEIEEEISFITKKMMCQISDYENNSKTHDIPKMSTSRLYDIVPVVSSLKWGNINISKSPQNELLSWWKGRTLLEMVDGLTQKQQNENDRNVVRVIIVQEDDSFVDGDVQTVIGDIVVGRLVAGDIVVIGPMGWIGVTESVNPCDRDEIDDDGYCDRTRVLISLRLLDCDDSNNINAQSEESRKVRKGNVVGLAPNPPLSVTSFRAICVSSRLLIKGFTYDISFRAFDKSHYVVCRSIIHTVQKRYCLIDFEVKGTAISIERYDEVQALATFRIKVDHDVLCGCVLSLHPPSSLTKSALSNKM